MGNELFRGLLFVLIGSATASIASGYDLGTSIQVGPGFFPLLLGLTVLTIGMVIIIRALLTREWKLAAFRRASWRESAAALRPLAAVVCAVLAFGLLIRPFGLVPAILVLLGISRLAADGMTIRETLVMAAVLTALPTAIFVYGLGVPIAIWTW